MTSQRAEALVSTFSEWRHIILAKKYWQRVKIKRDFGTRKWIHLLLSTEILLHTHSYFPHNHPSPALPSVLPLACGFIYHNPCGLAVSLRSCLFLFIPSRRGAASPFRGVSRRQSGDAVAGGVEDCRSGAKRPLNGSQTPTGYIDALARRQPASLLSVCTCVRVSGLSSVIAMLITGNSPRTCLKASNLGVRRRRQVGRRQ